MKRVRNEKEIGAVLTLYRMIREVGDDYLGIEVVVDSVKFEIGRDAVAHELRTARKQLAAAVAKWRGTA